MSLICSISNEVPEHPCVSPVSNHVYERRLIEKYIAENGTDPINNQPLSEEQLIDIKVAHPIRPKPPSATSIPAILKALQDEWDAVMLHSFICASSCRQPVKSCPTLCTSMMLPAVLLPGSLRKLQPPEKLWPP